MSPLVLVVDDDPTVSDVVRRYLERSGMRVSVYTDGLRALEAALSHPPDLVVLDLMLPSMDGLEVFRRLRAQIPVPVIMLTARGDEADRLVGLELGADDYITKPFSPRELVLRVRSVLRRAAAPTPDTLAPLLVDGELSIDVTAHQAQLGEALLRLTHGSTTYSCSCFSTHGEHSAAKNSCCTCGAGSTPITPPSPFTCAG